MEINITKFYEQENASDYQSSIAETGCNNIGQLNWQAAKNCSFQFVTEDNRAEILEHFLEYGAWERDEIDSIVELNAILIQDISSSIRERESFDTWAEFEKEARLGHVCSRLFKGTDGEIYFYVGS